MKKIESFFYLLMISTNIFSQDSSHLPDIIKPIESHWILTKIENGKPKYYLSLNDKVIKGKVNIYYVKPIPESDIINDYSHTGCEEKGTFKDGFMDGFWKTTYKKKLVKTINYNNGLVIGRYRVYNTKGELLYKTTFGSSGNGRYKDYYYTTGVLKEEGNYQNGKKEGAWCAYDEQGNLTKSCIFKRGVLLE